MSAAFSVSQTSLKFDRLAGVLPSLPREEVEKIMTYSEEAFRSEGLPNEPFFVRGRTQGLARSLLCDPKCKKVYVLLTHTRSGNKMERPLGSGGVKNIKRALDLEGGKIYAVAVYKERVLDSGKIQSIDWPWAEYELQCWERVKKIESAVGFLFSVRTESKIYVVYPWIKDGSIRSIIRKNPQFTLVDRLEIAIKAAGALKKIHEENIVHFDVKSENFLTELDSNGDRTVKIIDFGTCEIRELDPPHPVWARGTVFTWSPDRAMAVRYKELYRVFRFEEDVWSFGCIFLDLFYPGPLPWEQKTTQQISVMKESFVRTFIMNPKDPLPLELKKLILWVFSFNRFSRPTMAEVETALLKIHSNVSQSCSTESGSPTSDEKENT